MKAASTQPAAALRAADEQAQAAGIQSTPSFLIGAGFSAYLTYLELFVIHAICQWCVGSAILMASPAVLATSRLLRHPEAQPAEN